MIQEVKFLWMKENNISLKLYLVEKLKIWEMFNREILDMLIYFGNFGKKIMNCFPMICLKKIKKYCLKVLFLFLMDQLMKSLMERRKHNFIDRFSLNSDKKVFCF